MIKPKAIECITIEDLKAHRWCLYQGDDEEYNCFEHVIPDTHPDFSSDVVELELAEFTFENGEVRFGVFDGSESFSIFSNGDWISFWLGVAEPEAEDINNLRNYLIEAELKLPVKARAKWSGKESIFNGIRYINASGNICEIAILQ